MNWRINSSHPVGPRRCLATIRRAKGPLVKTTIFFRSFNFYLFLSCSCFFCTRVFKFCSFIFHSPILHCLSFFYIIWYYLVVLSRLIWCCRILVLSRFDIDYPGACVCACAWTCSLSGPLLPRAAGRVLCPVDFSGLFASVRVRGYVPRAAPTTGRRGGGW